MATQQLQPLYGQRRARHEARRFEAREAAQLADQFSAALAQLTPPLSTRTRALLGLGLRAVASASAAEDCAHSLRRFWNDARYRARLAGSPQLGRLAEAISPDAGWLARLPAEQQAAWSARAAEALERADVRVLLEDALSRASR